MNISEENYWSGMHKISTSAPDVSRDNRHTAKPGTQRKPYLMQGHSHFVEFFFSNFP